MVSRENQSKLIELEGILIAHATGRSADDERYKILRKTLMQDEEVSTKLPAFVVGCPSLSSFWYYIKEVSPTYQGRRDHIHASFQEASFTTAKTSTPSVFISHSSFDKFFVRKLAAQLEANGVKVWLDEAELNVGDSLTRKIGDAVRETRIFCVVLSHNSVGSSWVEKELQIAYGKEIEEKRTVILPILLEKVEIPAFLRDKVYADFTSSEKYAGSFEKLLKAIGVHIGSKEIEKEEIPAEPIGRAIAPTKDTSAGGRLARFDDLRITGLDKTRMTRPDPTKDLYNMYLMLSDSPPQEWAKIFAAERMVPRHSMWREATLEGSSIRVYCVPEELAQYHLPDLKQDVGNSNRKYREYLADLARDEASIFIREDAQSKRLDSLERKLKFD